MRYILASTIMLSSMLFPAAANASSIADDVSAPTQNLRISTGVIAPTLDESISIQLPEGLTKSLVPVDSKVGLSLTVDSNGRPQNVKVVKSVNPFWDARVVAAVQNSHFHPGTIDQEPIPVDMDLTVTLVP
jgi:TonB family protein